MASGVQSGESHQVAGQIDDPYGLAHVEDENFSAVAHGGGLQHPLRGLGDGHEEPLDFGVGHGDRAAAANLFLKDRHHAAVGGQHVAEADDHELRTGLFRKRVDETLGQLLRHAHDAGGIDGLVGRNHHELLHAVFVGQFGQLPGAQDVVLDGLAGVVLHHGNVLMRGRMKHDRRTMAFEYLCHAERIANVRDDGNDVRFGAQCLELLLDGEQAVFGPLDQQHGLGAKFEYLPADLRTDAAAGARDHDRSSGHQRADGVVVELHAFAPQQVVDVDVADLRRVAGRQKIVVGGDDLELDVRRTAALHQAAQLRPGQHARDDQHVFDAQSRGYIQGLRRLPPDHQARHRRTGSRGIRIQVADRLVLQATIRQQVSRQRFARLISPHDQGPAVSAAPQSGAQLFARQPAHGPQRPEHEDRHSQVQEQHAAGRVKAVSEQVIQSRDDQI